MEELQTRTSPEHANHSFNGCTSVLTNVSIETACVSGVSFGGAIGPYSVLVARDHERVYYRDPRLFLRNADVWINVARGFHAGTGQPLRVQFDEPVTLAPGDRVVLYLHSALQSDTGIAYQSYMAQDSVVAHDGNLLVTPGHGRIGPTPFGPGAHRAWRGICGSVWYRSQRLRWSVLRHATFPAPFRRTVVTLLLCHNRPGCLLGHLPYEVLFAVLEQLDWRDFDDHTDPADDDDAVAGARRRHRRGRGAREGCWQGCWGVVLRRLGYERVPD